MGGGVLYGNSFIGVWALGQISFRACEEIGFGFWREISNPRGGGLYYFCPEIHPQRLF